MSDKRSSGKRLMCVLCASLQSIVGTSLARDKRVNYRGTKFQFLNMGGIVRKKKKKGFVEGAIETVTNSPMASAAVAIPSVWAIAKGGEFAWKGVYRWYFKWFEYPEYYSYLYNCFNLAYGRISEIFSACKKNDNLSGGVGKLLEKLCGENGVYNSETGELSANPDSRKLKDVELGDINQLDGALFLLSETFSTGKMKNNEYCYDVIQNLRKILPGFSMHDSYKSFNGGGGLDPRKISSRVIVKDGRKYGRFARFAAGYGEFEQKLPFNPFPLIYLIRKYIVAKCLPKVEGKKFDHMVRCNCVNLSDSNPFVKNYGLTGKICDGYDEVDENYISFERTGNKLTIAFWLAEKEGEYAKGDEAKKVECTYTIPTVSDDKSKSVLSFDERWDKPKFVNVEPLKYDENEKLFK